MTDHNELRALALAATPGPWRVGRGSKSRIYAPYHVQPDGHAIARTYGSELNGIGVADLTGPVNIADAAYIAAANPATVLALLEALEALEGLTGDVQALIGESGGVAGLHMNGDVAPWGDLEAGGRFERLTHLPAAHAAITKVKGGAA